MANEIFRDQVQESQEKMQKALERGGYYKERQDYEKSIDEFIDAFQNFDDYYLSFELMYADSHIATNTSYIVNFFTDLLSILKTIFSVSLKLKNEGSGNRALQTYLAEKIYLILEKLKKYEREMNREQLEMLEQENQAEFKTVLLSLFTGPKGQEILEKTKAAKPEDQYYRLSKIRKVLQNLSSRKACSIEFEKKESSGCFIATAVYETRQHPDLDVFREFRDNQLLTNSFGKWLVAIYYKIGPSLAQYIANRPKLKNFTHQRLKYLAKRMKNQ